MTDLPALADRRLHLKMCSMYKFIPDLSYFPPNIVVPKFTRTYIGTFHTFQQQFARTNSFIYSIVPHSISQWNALPEVVSGPSLSTFKRYHKL